MASVTVYHLIDKGAGVVPCRTSCPITASALSKLGFWRRNPSPAYWWPADKLPIPGLFNLSTLHGDDALQVH
jgi:hypothetical protein